MIENYRKYEPLFGSWYINKLIGEGSYGQVYEIERRDFGVYKSALKIISIPKSSAEIEAARGEGMDNASLKSYYRSLVDEIVKEFALMSKLKGTANVVSYEDHLVIPHDDGIGWDVLIRMELLTSLKSHIDLNVMTERDIIKMGADICRALELCEKQKIIHRDIKPENIFISPNGDYKLGDFGIARTVEATMDGLSKKGTFFYMAPEVYRGGSYGSGVDIYSLGMVMYFFLNNKRHPFMPPSPQPIKFNDRENALRNLMTGKPLPRPVHGSDKLWAIVRKACEYRHENRFSSPGEMRTLLENLLTTDTSAADRIVLGAENPIGFGQYMYDTEQSHLPDGPGTAILDLVGDFNDNDATMDVNAAKRKAASYAAAEVNNRVNKNPAQKPKVIPHPAPPKKDGVGVKLLIGLIFAFILLIFLIFVAVSALSDRDNDNTPDNENNIEDTVIPDDEDNTIEDNTTDDNNNEQDNDKTPEKLTLSANVLNLEVGEEHILSVTVSPTGAEVGDIKWSSGDTNVATVTSDGLITAIGSGITGITVTMDGLTATCTVNVSAPVSVTGIELASPPNKTEYVVGESLSTEGLAIQVKYSDGSSETVTSGFSVNSEPFATAGTFAITISYSGHQVTFNVTVNEGETETLPEQPEI